MPDVLSLEAAVELARTGDVWLFRGRSPGDRAIRTLTNAPVNHVGMALVIEDLPPLMWHAELGRSLPDVWAGEHHRGVQLHDLRDAVVRWCTTYRQSTWLRQLTPEVGRRQEDAALRCVARLDGVSFPGAAQLAGRWFFGRDSYVPRRKRGAPGLRPEAAYCAETVAITLREMGVLADDRKANWYDPGTFWSGKYLPLRKGWRYGNEIPVDVPADAEPASSGPSGLNEAESPAAPPGRRRRKHGR